jgi:NitT/TauT family transport system substrate-binding protein
MIKIVSRYKNGEAWKKDITINEDEWKHIEEIIIAAGELNDYVDYDKLIYTQYFDNYE